MQVCRKPVDLAGRQTCAVMAQRHTGVEIGGLVQGPLVNGHTLQTNVGEQEAGPATMDLPTGTIESFQAGLEAAQVSSMDVVSVKDLNNSNPVGPRVRL